MDLEFEPLEDGLGVKATGLTEAAIADDEVLAELAKVLEQELLIYARIDDLTEPSQYRLATAFGTPTDRGGYGTSPDRTGEALPRPTASSMYVSNSRDDGILGKGRLDYHHDHLFYDDPLSSIMLYAIEVPASGSETRFRSGSSAFDALPAHIRERIRDVDCLHLYDYVKLAERRYRDWDDPATASPGARSDYKPWVWTQPVSGRKALLMSQSTIDFRGVEREEGMALYREIYTFLADHEDEIAHHYHHWTPGDLVVWDNMMVAHARMPFDKNEPRTLRRTPILGCKPR